MGWSVNPLTIQQSTIFPAAVIKKGEDTTANKQRYAAANG
jgi:hypothetical protein